MIKRLLIASLISTICAVSLIAQARITGTVLDGSATPVSSTGFGMTPGVIQADSQDFGGRVTVGVGGDTGGTVTLGGSYTVAPHCVANNEVSSAAVKISASTTVLTFSGTFTAADKITWVCR